MKCVKKELFKKWKKKIEDGLSNSADPLDILWTRHAAYMKITYPIDTILYERLVILIPYKKS